jgi:hypothetical protein
MGQPAPKRRLLDFLLVALLLLAAGEQEKPDGDSDAGGEEPKAAHEPWWYERRLLALLDRRTDGTLVVPSKAKAEARVSPSKDPRVRERSMMDMLDGFERAAKQSDSRLRTAMTGAAVALTIAGLLLREKADIVEPIAIGGAAFAFIGVAAAVIGHDFYVGRRPMQRPCMTDVLNARACLARKEFYAKLAAILITVALLAQFVSVAVARQGGAHEHRTEPTKNTAPPPHAIASPTAYSGGQARPHRTTAARGGASRGR